MIFSLTSRPATKFRGLRPIDLRRDLRPIANLIGEAFAGELDAGGRASLREMYMLARLGPLLYILLPTSGELGGFFRGFVWEEEGQIVGNVTMQQIDGLGYRWMIANVAVHPDFRGRGIARALMEATLARIGELGGRWAMLQVRANNEIARSLYRHLGFEELVTEIRLRCYSLPRLPTTPLPPGWSLKPLGEDHWSSANYVLHRAVPEPARWWHPTRHKEFRQGGDPAFKRWLGQKMGWRWKLRWGVYQGADIVGILDITAHDRGFHRLDVLLLPELRESGTEPLLYHALAELKRYGGRPIEALLYDYQSPAVETLRALGFRTQVELVSMRKRVSA
ncbi:MAG: GNAT family N-acetyltransferase [Caldilineae bacterium]|nr:MAG: GNAT family N-acetyltransferase [Caldilineae bacterium]